MAIHLREGMKEQWQRVRAGFGSSTPAIDSMETMYRSELCELHSSEQQLCALADELWVTIRNGPLSQRVSEYAATLRSREAELESLLVGIDTRHHTDDPMHALVTNASKMAEICGEIVRDAALVASLQRMIHYMIAEYGTIAAHAKALGRFNEAARFAAYAENEKTVDGELSELAKHTLNPQATLAASKDASADKRGH
jgi:ferritin-like metal-binding protein YciE